MKNAFICVALVSMLCFAALSRAQLPTAPPYPGPDDRYKADLLLIVGHPDDDALISAYLARAIFDEHKRVAAIVCTPGDGGGNEVAYESGAALGQVRIQEARRALEFLGVSNIWFLGGHDTPGQNVLWSLETWNHGRALDEMVRLVRLTRPEVILTLLPDQVAGENHADHQAAGVIATEAFDLAGDPTAFPEQVSPARDLHGMMNLTDGLHPWQPKKIYYFTDAFEAASQYWHDSRVTSPFRESFLHGTGPEYSTAAVSPSHHVSYGHIAAEEQVFYLTQEGSLGKDALTKGDFSDFEQPVHFIFGKSLVKSSVTGDIFEGVVPGAVPFAPVRGYQPQSRDKLVLEIGDPYSFYQEFWKAHNLEHLSRLVPLPEVAMNRGGTLRVPLLIRNDTQSSAVVSLTAVLPKDWTLKAGSALYPVAAGRSYPVLAILTAPSGGEVEWQELTFKAEASGRSIGSVTVRVLLGKSGGLPQ
jgi:LmbE family N-acetylglucosaminyl deacetylase